METLFPALTSSPDVHPALVHLPLGLWVGALVIWLVALFRRSDTVFRTGLWVLTLGVVLAVPTLVTGWLAMDRIGEGSAHHDAIHVHRDFMLITAGLAAVTAAAAWFAVRHGSNTLSRALLTLLFAGTVAVGLVGADRGALLVQKHGFGTRFETPAEAEAPHRHGHTRRYTGPFQELATTRDEQEDDPEHE